MLTYESQGTSTFLVYCMQEEENIDSMSMGMISNNKIEGVLPFQFSQLNEKRYLKYNVSAKITLRQYFEGVVNRERLLLVMDRIASIVLNAEDYMLESSAFLWNEDYIFVDTGSKEIFLICLPVEEQKENINIGQFLREILLSVQFDQSENCDYVARLLGFFNTESNFGLLDFKKLLTEIKSSCIGKVGYAGRQNTGSQEYSSRSASSDPEPEKRVDKAEPSGSVGSGRWAGPEGIRIPGTGGKLAPDTEKKVEEKKEEKKHFSLFGGKEPKEKRDKKAEKASKGGKKQKSGGTLPGGFGGMRIPGQPEEISISGRGDPASEPIRPEGRMETYGQPSFRSYGDAQDKTELLDETTELLDSGMTQVGGAWLELLESMMPGAPERVDLNFAKPFITVGRLSSDEKRPDVAFPGEFRKIGRQHARIERRGMNYYIIDLGSVNHTLLNGQELAPNREYQLLDGMEIALTTSKMVRYRVHMF